MTKDEYFEYLGELTKKCHETQPKIGSDQIIPAEPFGQQDAINWRLALTNLCHDSLPLLFALFYHVDHMKVDNIGRLKMSYYIHRLPMIIDPLYDPTIKVGHYKPEVSEVIFNAKRIQFETIRLQDIATNDIDDVKAFDETLAIALKCCRHGGPNMESTPILGTDIIKLTGFLHDNDGAISIDPSTCENPDPFSGFQQGKLYVFSGSPIKSHSGLSVNVLKRRHKGESNT